MPERVQFVDEHDNPIGAGTREEAWAKKINLRHSHMILLDENDRILLAQRSLNKKKNPGRWSSSAAGHVDEGETYERAADREMFEEIGVSTPLTALGKFHNDAADAFITVFSGRIASDTQVTIDTNEVATTKWYTKDEIRQLIKTDPEMFTIGFKEIFSRFFS